MTEILAMGGLHWGVWDGDLAIVDHYPERFDPIGMTRHYVVRRALDLHSKRPIAVTDWARDRLKYRMDVRVANGSVPYTQTTFDLGGEVWGSSRIRGTFAEHEIHLVPVGLGDLTDREHAACALSLRESGYAEIDDSIKVTKAKLGAMLCRTFMEIQAGPCEAANAADRILTRSGVDTCVSDAEVNQAWHALAKRGVFARRRNGSIKYVIAPKE